MAGWGSEFRRVRVPGGFAHGYSPHGVLSSKGKATRLRAALVGAGYVSDVHIAALERLGVEVVGIVDSDFERAFGKTGSHGVSRAYVNLKELLREVQPDVVHVLTPPATHAGLCIEAFAAGCHVYVEQPLATSDEDCARILDASHSAGRLLCVGHSLVFDPLMQRLRASIASHGLGDMVHLSASYNFDESRIPGFAGKWYRDLPGGFLEELAAHPASLFVNLLGLPQAVYSREVMNSYGDARGLMAMLEWEHGTGSLHVSLDARPESLVLDVRGTRASAALDFTDFAMEVRRSWSSAGRLGIALGRMESVAQRATRAVERGTRTVTRAIDATGGVHSLVEAFYNAIGSGGASPVSGTEGRRVVALLRELWPPDSGAVSRPRRRLFTPAGQLLPAEVLSPLPDDAGETALVTGATGVTGRRLVAALVKRGVRVRALARSAERGRSIARDGVEVVVGDLADPEVIPGLAEGAQVVYHLASTMSGSWESFRLTDIAGTRRLLEECGRAGVRRFVFTSTLSVLSESELAEEGLTTGNGSSNDVSRAGNPYARAKLAIERMILREAAAGTMEAVILRPGLVYGPGRSAYLTHLPGLGTRRGDRYVLFGDGNVPLPISYVENVVSALILAASAPGASGGVFTILDDDPPTQREYVQRLGELTGRPLRVTGIPRAGAYLVGLGAEGVALLRNEAPATTRRRLVSMTERMQYDCSEAKELLGWTPGVSWSEGLARNVEWESKRNGRGAG